MFSIIIVFGDQCMNASFAVARTAICKEEAKRPEPKKQNGKLLPLGRESRVESRLSSTCPNSVIARELLEKGIEPTQENVEKTKQAKQRFVEKIWEKYGEKGRQVLLAYGY